MTVKNGYEPSSSWHALGCEPGPWYTAMNHQAAGTHWSVSQDSDTRLWTIKQLARTGCEPGQWYTVMNHQTADTHWGVSQDSDTRLWTIKQLTRTGVWARTVIHGYEPSSSWHALGCEPWQWYTAMNHQAAGTHWGVSQDSDTRLWTTKQLAHIGLWARTVILLAVYS